MSVIETTALPHETVWSIATAATSARALHLVADLGVADLIDDTPVTVEEIASGCDADAVALDRVLRLLVAGGIFERCDDGYTHTSASRLLRSDHPTSMRAFAQMMGLPVFWASFGALGHAVRTGATALEQVEPTGLWAHLRAYPDRARVFDEAMSAKAAGDIDAVLGAYDFRPFRTIADIGGGRGHLLRAVLEAVPQAQGVLFDLPSVIDPLGGSAARVTHHAGDFFVDPLPRADAYMLMEVIHDWADGEAVAILRAIRRAASRGATVLIIEDVLSEDDADIRARTLDVIMLAITGGRERTRRELDDLLHRADFRLSTVIETAAQMRIVEAVAT